MAKCKQISFLVSKSLDKKLSWSERLAVSLHLMICHGCNNFAKQASFLRDVGQGYFAHLQKNTSDVNDTDKT